MKQNTDENDQTLDSLLDSYLSIGLPTAGEIRDSFIVAIYSNRILVDIGAKSEGIIGSDEMSQLGNAFRKTLSVGQELRVCVIEPEDEEGNILVSHLKVSQAEEWETAVDYHSSGEITECTITGCNRGGLLAKLGSLRGFIPTSQLAPSHHIDRGGAVETQLQKMIGTTMSVKIIDAQPEQGRLILSELEAERSLKHAVRESRFAEIKVGDVYDGKVINITKFGAFVDIGDIEGLVHLTELTWQHIEHPSEILTIGQDVKVIVKETDSAKQRLNFSMKLLESNPWQEAAKIYQVNVDVDVTITQLTRYGAFARINDDLGLEGLIHISELADQHIKNPSEIVSPNDVITVRVIRIDPEQKQIAFSLKQVESESSDSNSSEEKEEEEKEEIEIAEEVSAIA